ncbi:CAP domain-containing protein [Filobasidium floriforme]|uniref:CAP domain-containing protein n=1 Tax=Filobasidium floriforme TaxID=5210 RepID=UPI001E8EA575|nr:CAP domain-containing protein [Filobasidium floriforme]KAH8078003.1 CAP domain-containing protein [Filobasidium floriforme]
MLVVTLFRILPLLVIGTPLVTANTGLIMRRAGRPGNSNEGVNVRGYDQCISHCGQAFDEGNVNTLDRPGGMMAVQTDLASSTRTRKTRPTSCRRKPGRSSARPARTGSTSSVVSSQTSSTVSTQVPGTEAAQTSLATEVFAPVETATTTGTEIEAASSTGETLQEEPTSVIRTTEAQSQSPTAAATSLTTPEATQAPSSGVGGPDRSRPEDWLKAHNDERAKYGAEPIAWNDEMASVAQAWGAHCSWGHSQGIYGENIAASIAADTDPVRTATGLWIGEAADYDYDNPVGAHWTQMVWKGLGEIGCAAVDCPASTAEDKKTIWTLMVCEYKLKPGANGSFAENVGRPVV